MTTSKPLSCKYAGIVCLRLCAWPAVEAEVMLGAARSERDVCKAKLLLKLASSVTAGMTSTYSMEYKSIVDYVVYDEGWYWQDHLVIFYKVNKH